MKARITPGIFNAAVTIPASKSHTIRRLLCASLTQGVSRIERPLESLDAQSCAEACRILGAEIIEERDNRDGLCAWLVRGRKPGVVFSGSAKITHGSGLLVDVGNSGTTLFLALAAAALGSVPVTFTGDKQIACRSAAPLLDALAGLGVSVTSSTGPDGKAGCTPITVCGPWKGGRVTVSCPTSQYLSALLLAAPLAPSGTITEIDVPLLNEKPYIEMTLSYLKAQGLYGNGAITAAADFSRFRIRGGNSYMPINGPVPGDFSSAAFPAAAAAITKGKVTLLGLDPNDTQGDKVFFEYLQQMGCDVTWLQTNNAQWQVTVSRSGPLKGGVFDLNATPDMLPVMAALGAFAENTTALVNAAHARIKETDRIAVMAAELRKLFSGSNTFRCEEQPDGLLIHGVGDCVAGTGGESVTTMPAVTVDGHDDHRIVMALACAALGCTAPVEIDSAEAADVTYPGFLDLLG
jgi:3-phosphoshikimate 1-carboxyvinyltransferase